MRVKVWFLSNQEETYGVFCHRNIKSSAMIRRVLLVVIGVLAGGTAVWLVENWLSHKLIDHPDSQFPQDPEMLGDYIASLPSAALWMIVLAMFAGGFVASYIARLVAKGDIAAARDAGFVMLILTIMNLFGIPHPTWMMIAMPLATILGSLLAIGIKKNFPKED